MADLKTVTLAIDADKRTKTLVFAEYFAFESEKDITADFSGAKFTRVVVGPKVKPKTLNGGDPPVVNEPNVPNQPIKALVLRVTAEGGSPFVPLDCPYKDGQNGHISLISLTYYGIGIDKNPIVVLDSIS